MEENRIIKLTYGNCFVEIDEEEWEFCKYRSFEELIKFIEFNSEEVFY